MPFPLGERHTEEARRKMREAAIRRCADPVVKAEWLRTPMARRHWLSHHRPWVRDSRAESKQRRYIAMANKPITVVTGPTLRPAGAKIVDNADQSTRKPGQK